MKRSRLLIFAVTFVVAGTPRAAAAAPCISPNRLPALNLLAGRWVTMNAPYGEESWLALHGRNLTGTYREFQGRRTSFFEILTIDDAEGCITLHLRHFNGDLTAWEEKSKVWSYRAVELTSSTVIFRRADGGTEITYKRSGATHLSGTVIHKSRGKIREERFRYVLDRP